MIVKGSASDSENLHRRNFLLSVPAKQVVALPRDLKIVRDYCAQKRPRFDSFPHERIREILEVLVAEPGSTRNIRNVHAVLNHANRA